MAVAAIEGFGAASVAVTDLAGKVCVAVEAIVGLGRFRSAVTLRVVVRPAEIVGFVICKVPVTDLDGKTWVDVATTVGFGAVIAAVAFRVGNT